MFRSVQERRLWIAALVSLVVSYGMIVPGQVLLSALRERGFLGRTVSALFVVTVILLAGVVARTCPRWPEIALYLFVGGIYVAILRQLTVIQERIHFLQYGLLAGFVYLALRARRRETATGLVVARAAVIAAVVAGLAGWGDEGIQSLVPTRVYDVRDIGFNALGGLLAATTLALRELLRRPPATQASGVSAT